jgi:hypothetical protein
MPSPEHSAKVSFTVKILALLTIVMHCAINYYSPYGFHRDEFLYFAMGDHLQLWRMDFPPLIGIIANCSRILFGDSMVAMRFFPALAGGLMILIAADSVRCLGGKSFAQILSAMAILASALYLRTANLFQPVVFDELWWTLGLWCLLRWRNSGNNRWWIGLGIVMGFGLLTKFSIVFFGFGVLIGLLATNERRLLVTRWPWIALALTLIIGIPSIVGQIRLGFPVAAQLDDLRSSQLIFVSYSHFILGQFLILGIAAVVAITGIVALLLSQRFSSYRILGWVFIGSFTILLLTHGKEYYLGPIYPLMIAAGAVIFEQVGTGRMAVLFRSLTILVITLLGLVVVPLGLPIFTPSETEQYCRRHGITVALKTNRNTTLRLPQDYADMLGWEDRVIELSKIFNTLTPAQRTDAVILARNYGEAGAIDFFGPRLGLPHALCTSGSYWFFGPGQKSGKVAIAMGCDKFALMKNWLSVKPIGHLKNEWTVEEEQDLTFYLCEDEIQSVQNVWPLFEGKN